MNKSDLKELNFLAGYLMYLRVENRLFKPYAEKYNLLKNKLDEERKEEYFKLKNMGVRR